MEGTNFNFRLFRKLKTEGLYQRDLAKMVNEDESVISRVVNGVWNPSEAQKIKYAKALKCKVDDLFKPTE